MANSTLAAIQTKVRRLTRTPSVDQMSDATLNEYINTFVLYDFPEHLRLFTLHTTFSFVTNPGQDQYPTGTDDLVNVTTNPLYNFKNIYITSNRPVYIAGFESYWSQDRTEFFRVYPFINSILNTADTGDGIVTQFTGTLQTAGATAGTVLLQENVYFMSADVNGLGMSLVDVPVVDAATGQRTLDGNLYVVGQQPSKDNPPTVIIPTNTINYSTGVYTVTFPSAPGNQVPINSQTVPMVSARPLGLLYYNNIFTVRPIPDAPYAINIEVFKRPTELLATNQSPDLEQWWQYIAYGASKKIFEDRMDLESVALIMPEFEKQEVLVLRRTIVQQTQERTATIYTENTAGSYGSGWFYGGGQF